MSWYNEKSNTADTVISTRARLARNIAGIPFPSKMTENDALHIIDLLTDAIAPLNNDFQIIRTDKLSQKEQQVLVEKHLISPAFVGNRIPRAVMINKSEDISIMVNEEDHIRIQSIVSGLNISKAYDNASKIDDLIGEKIDFAFHEKYGYLTACPTNTGTGLRISAMLHLPALSISGNINGLLSQIAKSGFTVRGMFGEGSQAEGNFFQLSNQITLGYSEDEILNKFQSISDIVCNAEQSLRDKFKKDISASLSDKLLRSYGILRYCKLLSGKEMLNLISDVRFGIYLGIIKPIPFEKLNEVMITAMPASIMGKDENMSPNMRDAIRAKALNSLFAE